MLLEYIKNDIKDGKIKIIKQKVQSKVYYRMGRKINPRTSIYYYLKFPNGDKLKVNKKFLEL